MSPETLVLDVEPDQHWARVKRAPGLSVKPAQDYSGLVSWDQPYVATPPRWQLCPECGQEVMEITRVLGPGPEDDYYASPCQHQLTADEFAALGTGEFWLLKRRGPL